MKGGRWREVERERHWREKGKKYRWRRESICVSHVFCAGEIVEEGVANTHPATHTQEKEREGHRTCSHRSLTTQQRPEHSHNFTNATPSRRLKRALKRRRIPLIDLLSPAFLCHCSKNVDDQNTDNFLNLSFFTLSFPFDYVCYAIAQSFPKEKKRKKKENTESDSRERKWNERDDTQPSEKREKKKT